MSAMVLHLSNTDDQKTTLRMVREIVGASAINDRIREEVISDVNLELARRLHKDPDFTVTRTFLKRVVSSVKATHIDLLNRGQVGLAMSQSGTRKSAQLRFRSACAEKEQTLGRPLTRREEEKIAHRVIETWHDPDRRPTADFWIRRRFEDIETANTLGVVEDFSSSDFTSVYMEMDNAPTETTARNRARYLVWNAIAPTCPIVSLPSEDVETACTIVRNNPECVLSACREWINHRTHRYSWLIFAPFGLPDDKQKDEIVRVLLITPALANDLLLAAYRSAAHQMDMNISAHAQVARESARSPRTGRFGDQHRKLSSTDILDINSLDDVSTLFMNIRRECNYRTGRNFPKAYQREEVSAELVGWACDYAVTFARSHDNFVPWDQVRRQIGNYSSRIATADGMFGTHISIDPSSVNSANVSGRKRFFIERAHAEMEVNRLLTRREEENLSARVRESFPKGERPTPDYMQRHGVPSTGDAVFDFMNTAAPIPDELSPFDDIDIESLTRQEATRIYLDERIPGAVIPDSLSRRTSRTIRATMKDVDILSVANRWEQAEDDEQTEALFAPFSGAQSDRERQDVVDFLRENPGMAMNMWDRATTLATRQSAKK